MESLGSFDRALTRATDRFGQVVSAHPRSLTTAVMLALAGFGATAFGIAPSTPDAAHLPQRLIAEKIVPQDLETQFVELSGHELSLYRSDVTRSGDTADSLLRRMSVDDAAAAKFLRNDAVARALLEGRAGKMVEVRTNGAGELGELISRFAASGDLAKSHFTRLTVSAEAPGRFRARTEVVPLKAQQRLGSGTIRTSLFASTDDAQIPDAVAIQLAEIFSADIDFHRELRRGDRFSVVYEALTADGETITWSASVGRVVAAEFINKGKTYSAVWFKEPQGKGGYYDFDGKSRSRSYLTSPLEFSRTTSGFAMRMHPILKQWRRHNGVDYAAPRGTPVRSVGDGLVEFAGRQSGYGNVVQVKHRNDRATVYAHLSRIDVKVGQRVDQGDRIGAVGATGWATGPHLHFEFKVGGVHINPAVMVRDAEAVSLTTESLTHFEHWAQGVRAPLAVAQTMERSESYSE
jgi:murein DD-endopeptidase MepM/ murein hydrolase activator NlpD